MEKLRPLYTAPSIIRNVATRDDFNVPATRVLRARPRDENVCVQQPRGETRVMSCSADARAARDDFRCGYVCCGRRTLFCDDLPPG